MLLRAKVHREHYISRNKLAGSLCVCGIVFILLSIMISRVWADDSFWKDFALYILDIIATVPFWGAMEIFFIDNREDRDRVKCLKRIGEIRFNELNGPHNKG